MSARRSLVSFARASVLVEVGSDGLELGAGRDEQRALHVGGGAFARAGNADQDLAVRHLGS